MINVQRVHLLTATIVLSGALSACSAFRPCQSADCVADAKITAAVESRLMQPALEVHPIDVQTVHGVVYLRGGVDTEYERGEAAELAQVPGENGIENELYVLGNY